MIISFLGGLLTWPNEDDQMNLTTPWQQQTLIIEIDRNWNQQTFWNQQTLTLCPGSSWFPCLNFFSWKEWSHWATKAGQVSQPVQACVKLMFVTVVNFDKNKKIRFVGVKNFRSCSTTTFGHLHKVKLTSLSFRWSVPTI